MLRFAACLVLLHAYMLPVSVLAQVQQSKPAPPPALANATSLAKVKIQSLQMSPQGGRLRFMHEGKLMTGDLSNTKVYRMVGGKKVEVPRAQWQAALDAARAAGTPVTVVVPKTNTQNLVVIAIIAILIGLLLPAVQKVRTP